MLTLGAKRSWLGDMSAESLAKIVTSNGSSSLVLDGLADASAYCLEKALDRIAPD